MPSPHGTLVYKECPTPPKAIYFLLKGHPIGTFTGGPFFLNNFIGATRSREEVQGKGRENRLDTQICSNMGFLLMKEMYRDCKKIQSERLVRMVAAYL
jgi:hypothetical protein